MADKEYTVKYKVGTPARTDTGRPIVDYSVASIIKVTASSEEDARKKALHLKKYRVKKKELKQN